MIFILGQASQTAHKYIDKSLYLQDNKSNLVFLLSELFLYKKAMKVRLPVSCHLALLSKEAHLTVT